MNVPREDLVAAWAVVDQVRRERDEARRVLLDVLDGYATCLASSAKHRADRRTLLMRLNMRPGRVLRDGAPEPQP